MSEGGPLKEVGLKNTEPKKGTGAFEIELSGEWLLTGNFQST